jgi:subtilase family serine protease
MYSRSYLRITLYVLGLVTVLTSVGNAVVSNRIASAITENRMPLQHTVSPRAKTAIDLGSAPGSLKLEGLTMRFNMTDAQQAALSQLLLDQQNPNSPRYHQWLTPQQFGTLFGLSAGDISKVSSWLTGQGFTVTKVANSSSFITFNGTASQVQHAFGTTVHTLSRNGQKHIGNLTEPTLPVAIASVVSNITGLNDFRARPHLHTHQVSSSLIHPQNTLTTTAGTAHFIAPGDFYTIYDLNPLLNNSYNGTGITIAVMGQVNLNTYLSDVTAFRTVSGLDASNLPTTTLYGTDPGTPTGACLSDNPPNSCTSTLSDLQESVLDVEWAGAAAPAAKIIFATSTDVIDTSLVQAIDKNIAPIMTVSYGACEADFSPSQLAGLNLDFQQANVQGITIFGPTGDDGATDCDVNVSSATQGLAVDFPGSSPYVTALGGTMFNEGSGTYWNATNGANGGSATSYIPETVWNETSIDNTGTSPSFGAGGGGASAIFAKPLWQAGSGVPNDFSRDVPDVALNAASNHDGYLVCFQASCTGGNYYNTTTGSGNVFGGTSVATPTFAGIIALVEQKLGGGRLGNINPNLYALAGSTYYNTIFHDVTAGNNESPCTAGTTNCPNGGTIGFTAGPGYDQASGLGSVDASVLATDWPLVTPVIVGTQIPSQTTVTANPTSVTAGATVALTINVAAGTTSAGTPSGTVQVLVDGTAVPSSSTALTSGSATYSLSTTSLSSGTHTVTAFYSGDSSFNTSKGTVSIDVISASAPDFTLTPSTTTITVASGGSSSGAVFTVTQKNGFTGTIAFTSAGTINATYSATPASVSIGSATASATTTYVLQAFVSNSNLRTGKIRLKLASLKPPSTSAPSHSPWYITGSGSVLACLLLIAVPRRRRWASLLVVMLSVAVLSGVGCSSSSTTNGSPANGQSNTPSGTYTVQFIATGTPTSGSPISHSATVTVVIQ